MSIGRDFAVLAALEHYHQLKSSLKERHTKRHVDNTFRLLDGFSGVGALALRWSSTLPLNVPIEITANDRSTTCQQLIKQNIHTNSATNVFVTCEDINCVLSEDAIAKNRRPFDIIHLDPFGCVVQHLDAAFRCLSNGGILSFTSTDVSALCDRRYVNVAKRHYGVHLNGKRNPLTFRDTALRILLSAVAKSAARQDKGIKILTAVSLEHFFLIQVQILRGTKEADQTASLAEWFTEEKQGPLWSGKLGDPTWLLKLSKHAQNDQHVVLSSAKNQKKIIKLLGILVKENVGELSSLHTSQAQSKIISLHSIVSEMKLGKIPKKMNQKVCDDLSRRYGTGTASPTHLDPRSIRTIASRSAVIDAVQGVVSTFGMTRKGDGAGGREVEEHIGGRKRTERLAMLSGSCFIIVLLHVFPAMARATTEVMDTLPAITTVTLPLTNFNVGSLVLLLLLAILGAIYLHKLLIRQSCVCKLCHALYTIEAEIGHGGFGKVFSVRHKSERKSSYVMKKIPVRNLNEANIALAEAKLLLALDHPNLVMYQDDFIHVELPTYGVTGLEPQLYVCIVMEKCIGGDLREFIERTRENEAAKYLETSEVLPMLIEISSALAYCHANEVVHRDIKPHNVFLHEDLGCRLGDFGLSRRWKTTADTTADTTVGTNSATRGSLTTCGTEFYRPPELFNAIKGAIDYMKVDVWCLGLLFVELLTLEYVYEWGLGVLGAKVGNKEDQSLSTLLTNIPEHFPPQIVDICRQMLSRRPQDRPSMDAVLHTLQGIETNLNTKGEKKE